MRSARSWGDRRGRMVLVGLAPDTEQRKRGAAWVVRCDCGNYEHRSNPVKWLAQDADDACRECATRFYLTHGYALTRPRG